MIQYLMGAYWMKEQMSQENALFLINLLEFWECNIYSGKQTFIIYIEHRAHTLSAPLQQKHVLIE